MSDKAHQAENLLENYLVSDQERQILSNAMPVGIGNSGKVSQMTVRQALQAYKELQQVSIYR